MTDPATGRTWKAILDGSLHGISAEGDEGGRRLLPQTTGEIRPARHVVRKYARRALELSGGNRTAAAKALGISRDTLKGYVED